MKHSIPLSLIVSSLFFMSCSDSPDEAANTPSVDPGADGAVETANTDAGDATIVTLTAPDSGLDPANVGSSSVAPHPLKERFSTAAGADAILITVPANGMRPLDKEQILLAGLLQPSKTFVVLTDSGSVGEGSADANFDAAAWLGEQAAEIEALCESYGVSGAVIATDSTDAAGDFEVKGWDAVLASAASAAPRSTSPRESATSAEATITIQKMSEAPSPHAIQTVKNGDKKDFVFASGGTKAVIELDDPISPGNSAPAELQLENAVDLAVGDKFVITRMGSIVGLGEITDL